MGKGKVNIRPNWSQDQFERLVEVVRGFANQGLWGGGISIYEVETNKGLLIILQDIGEDGEGYGCTYNRVRIFESHRRACAKLVLSTYGIPYDLNICEGSPDFSRLIGKVVTDELPACGYWEVDFDRFLKKEEHDRLVSEEEEE